MGNLTSYIDFSGTIKCEEVSKALSSTNAVIAESALNVEYAKMFKLGRSCSEETSLSVKCLYLYAYALQSVDLEGNNFLTEAQLAGILSATEQISKSCCCNE